MFKILLRILFVFEFPVSCFPFSYLALPFTCPCLSGRLRKLDAQYLCNKKRSPDWARIAVLVGIARDNSIAGNSTANFETMLQPASRRRRRHGLSRR